MKARNYEVWIEGDLGLHKGKPVMYGVFTNLLEAQAAMRKVLKSGKFATLKTREPESE